MSPLLALLMLQAEKPVATIKLDAKTATVGQAVKGTLTLTLPEGQHGYQNPPADKFENPITLKVAGAGFRLGKVEYPKGRELTMTGAEKPSRVYEGTIKVPFTLVPTKTMPKAGAVSFTVDYQLCTMSNCYPPGTLALKAPLKVAAKKAARKP